MHPGRHQECGSATPPVYPAYHPTAEAGGYLKDGRSATACPDTLTHKQRHLQDRSSATACPDTLTHKQRHLQDRGYATAGSDIRRNIERTCEDVTEKCKKVACCGSCRRATIFQVTPGFSRGVRMAIKHGVAEPHS